MNGRLVRRGSMLVSAAVVSVVALSGCSTDETAAPNSTPNANEETATVVTTTTTVVEEDSQVAEAPNPDVDDTDSDGGSSTSADLTQDEAIAAAIASLQEVEPADFGQWNATEDTNWDSTSDLTYVYVVQSEAPHSTTESAVLLFHKGKYVGTAGGPQTINSVEGDGNTVTVNFFDSDAMMEDGGAFAFKDQYNAPVTYSWNGSQVSQDGEIPTP
ncbi:MAG: LppP/LprE family lipoprotein [Corynebacterium sp.]|uniref:LppP/LprE family lipoprotein n=1 Tax=Corynebacterium sp. TaxID=1720 RepID=UPI0026DC03BB|nr:LppP/LprE family lipoprotein [Corynebacterium sp.]MDO5029839.1 LppP/LprE family lipoprotein [Corynebacterium sp.]